MLYIERIIRNVKHTLESKTLGIIILIITIVRTYNEGYI